MKVCFTIPGRPVPKARPRVVKGRAYTPAASAAYARLVLMLARKVWPKGWPLDARYSVEVVVTPADGNVGDGDNYLKAATDPLRGLAWSDDRRVKRWVCEILEPAKDTSRMDVTIAVLPVHWRKHLAAELIRQRGADRCNARQGHADDCTPYLARCMTCPDCPIDHAEEYAEIVESVRGEQ